MDVGGDVIGSHAWQALYAFQWFVPSRDIFNIIVEYNDGNSMGLRPISLELCAGEQQGWGKSRNIDVLKPG